MGENDPERKSDRQFVSSLARGLGILSAFGPDDTSLSNQELAERTGLPRPTVSRFTHTLRRLNYLVYHGKRGRFSLAPRVLELGEAAFAATGIREIARPVMEALSELGDVSVSLGVPGNSAVRYIEMARRPEAIVLNLNVGALVPLPQTAIGRAYLADLPEPRRAAVIAGLQAADPETWARHEVRVVAAISEFKSRGYAASFGDWWPELSAIATTIRTVEDGDPLLLSIAGLSSVMTPDRAEREYAPALVSTARAIQTRLQRRYLE